MRNTTLQHRRRTVRSRGVALAVSTAMLLLANRVPAQIGSSLTPQQESFGAATHDSAIAADGTQFRAFPLRQMDVQTAQRQLAQFFASTPDVEIVPDSPRNRVLVRATPSVLDVAELLLERLDKPAAAPAVPAPVAPPAQQLEAYPLTPITRSVISAIQQRASQEPGIRVAIDERTSQALILAPTEVQDQLRAQISQAGQVAAVPTPGSVSGGGQFSQIAAPANPNATTAPIASQAALRLRHLRADELRVRLEKLLSRPLPASGDSSGQWQTFSVEAAPGAEVSVTVNPLTGDVHLTGPPNRTGAWQTVIEALDAAPDEAGNVTELVTTRPAAHDRVRKLLEIVQSQSGLQPRGAASMVSAMLQPGDAGAAGQPNAAAQAAPGQAVSPNAQTALDAANIAQAAGELLGPVDIQYVEGLDVIVIRGSERDVQRVVEIINQIEQLSAVTVPAIEIYTLQNVDSRAMAALLSRLYDPAQVLGSRLGAVSITPLVKPNALLLIGRSENVRMAIDLVQRLDQPVQPATRFEVFPLRNASANEAKTLIDEFLAQDEGEDQAAEEAPTLAPRAMIVADFRTNSLIVSAGPRDMAEISQLITRIDAPSGAAVDQVRVFPLRNAVATEMVTVLQAAIRGEAVTDEAAQGTRPSALEFLRIGGDPGQPLTSGVLTGVRLSADARANSIVVTAPADSMELIAALIAQLDQTPNVAAELKVFTLENGDAEGLTTMLRTLFGVTEDNQQQAVGGVGAGGLVRMQFSVDARTNSIIAAGTRDDLAVVEAILLRLDSGDVRERVNVVYRLNNASAEDVSNTLNTWLQTQRTAEADAALAISPFEQIEREVIVVPEIATNSLVVSATPRYLETVQDIIRQLDERPPMVMIQVLIAEVRLNDTDEFGVELGLQDSLLFDRSLLGDFQTITTTTEQQSAGGAVTTTTQDTIVNAPLNPGFNFNNQQLGNNGSTNALATAANVAAQGLSNFSLGRVNSDLQFGGFVFSASSNSVSVLLRALQEKRRLEILSRPQIMALDGQPGYVQVGQEVPTITGVTQNIAGGQTNSIIYRPVGIIMQVVPRISPDGLVVMTISTEKSEVGPEAEGIPIFVSETGVIVRAPRIDATNAYTTVSALSGQTVVLSGLLTNRRQDVHRRVPLIAEIPLIGDLFRYDLVAEQRTELLIILTPQIVNNKLESDILKQVESSRMSWILSDVVNLHGEAGLRSRCDEWYDGETEAVYPTYVPQEGELLPAPTDAYPVEGPILEVPATKSSEPTQPEYLQPGPARLPRTSSTP